MALAYEPGSADRYIRGRNGELGDWAGTGARAALQQSRSYYQRAGEEAAGLAPNLPDAAVFGGLAGSDALFDSQFRQAEADSQLAGEMLEARGNILNAQAQAAGARKAASAQRTGAIASAAVGVAGAVGAALI